MLNKSGEKVGILLLFLIFKKCFQLFTIEFVSYGFVMYGLDCVKVFSSVSCPTLRPHEPQHARPPCPSPTPMSIESVMPSNHLILCCPLLLLPSIFPIIRVFSNESDLHIRWPKYWSFSFNISPSSEHSGLISFRMGSSCSPRDSQESSPTPLFKSINSSALSFLYSPTLISIHDYWKNHNLD